MKLSEFLRKYFTISNGKKAKSPHLRLTAIRIDNPHGIISTIDTKHAIIIFSSHFSYLFANYIPKNKCIVLCYSFFIPSILFFFFQSLIIFSLIILCYHFSNTFSLLILSPIFLLLFLYSL